MAFLSLGNSWTCVHVNPHEKKTDEVIIDEKKTDESAAKWVSESVANFNQEWSSKKW